MPEAVLDPALLGRLPLPLARLCRDAHNARNPQELHQTAYYLWEVGLKLLGSAAIATIADRPQTDPAIAKKLSFLSRPSLGHWRSIVRDLPAILAKDDAGFAAVHTFLTGRARDDLPRCAGLDAALRNALSGKGGAKTTVQVGELFDRLVTYRNDTIGHGAVGRHGESFYESMGQALLAGATEMFGRLDVIAGRKLVFIAAVEGLPSGEWRIQTDSMMGEAPSKLPACTVPASDAAKLPRKGRLYLDGAGGLTDLTPLARYLPESHEFFLLNSRDDKARGEYLDYRTGATRTLADFGGDENDIISGAIRLTPAELRAVDATPPADSPGAKSGPRRSVGEFELLGKLGQGGMGIVYRAVQPSLRRQVALKCMFKAGNPEWDRRFAREIRALGEVSHPNLVRIFHAGNEGDQWFYAMELLEGATLAAVSDQLQVKTKSAAGINHDTWRESFSSACSETRKAEERYTDEQPAEPQIAPTPPTGGYVGWVVELVRQTAEAAHALHEAKDGGIIHRDIKPGNIMVSPDGSRAVLVDLGLAQLADAADGKLTRTRQFVGTLRYASPEQVLSVDLLDRRSDVYSLGATLWEMLTLRPLFNATDATPTAELMKRIPVEDPERPRIHNPSVPPDLEAIALKCLEKNPKDRYATAREFADDLARWQRGEPVEARTHTLAYRIQKWTRKHWRSAAMIGVPFALIAGLTTVVIAMMLSRPTGRSSMVKDDSRPTPIVKQETKVAHPQPPVVQALAAKAHAILKTNCARCHDGTGKNGAEFDVLGLAWMTSGKIAGVIVPGKPEESLLYKRVMSGEMPPEKSTPRPSEEDKKTLYEWIAAGAPAFVGAKRDEAKPDTAAKPSAPADEGKQMLFSLVFKDAQACRDFTPTQSMVLSRVDEFLDVLVPADSRTALAELDSAPGREGFQFRGDIKLPKPVAAPSRPLSTRGTLRAPWSMPDRPSGKGVIVAILDTGIDIRHPDFVALDAGGRPVSRLLWFWDVMRDFNPAAPLGQPAQVRYPNDAPAGTFYDRHELTEELRSASRTLGEMDDDGHGTACAGIAVGNGRARAEFRKSAPDRPGDSIASDIWSHGSFSGVAADADIIAVRVSSPNSGFNLTMFNHICTWIDRVAGDRPVVIVCSYGGNFGGRDGNLVSDRQLARLLPDTLQGRIVVTSAGNDGNEELHFGATVTSSQPTVIKWTASERVEIEAFVRDAKLEDVLVKQDGARIVGQPGVDRQSRDLIMRWEVRASGSITLATTKSGSFAVDAYLSGVRSREPARFLGDGVSNRHLIGSPGSARNVITVGSYDFNDKMEFASKLVRVPVFPFMKRSESMVIGQASNYSPAGPLRGSNVVKPELLAPGQWHIAPRPTNARESNSDDSSKTISYFNLHDDSKLYGITNGTTATAAYTAGVAALLLEKKPSLSAAEFRELLKKHLTKDQFTGDLPNPLWGYGKLDKAAVERLLEAVSK